MIRTPDPFGVEDPPSLELVELCSEFAPTVLQQLERDTLAVYGGWALACWGFPFRLYAEQADEMRPLDNPREPAPGHYDSARASPVWDELGTPFLVGGQWRAAYAHGHSVPLDESERAELEERHRPAQADTGEYEGHCDVCDPFGDSFRCVCEPAPSRASDLGMDEAGAFSDADMAAIQAALEGEEH